jgi:tetratricopeptide (TPR) repeat protein
METTLDPTEQANLKVSLARLRKEQFGDLDRAIQLLEEVFAEHPNHPEAASTLAAISEEDERFVELTQLLLRQASVASEQGEDGVALDFHRRAAHLFEEQLKDLERAIETWGKVRENEDTLEVIESIYRLQLAADKREAAATSLEEICSSLEGEARLSRRSELADLYRSLGDTDAVIRTMLGTLQLDPENLKLRAMLRSEYELAGRWQEVADMVVEEAEKADSTAGKIDLLREAAAIHMQKRKDGAEGAELLGRASALAPDDRELMLELCDAYSAAGRGSAAVEVLEKIVESYGGKRSKELGEVHRRLATAYLSQNEAEKALGELDKAFRIEPGNIHILTQLGDTALAVKDMKKAQQMFRALLLQRLDDSSPITKAQVFCRLGQVHKELGETAKAKQMFERALQTDKNLEEAQQGLAEL